MKRKEFLSTIGIGAAALACSACFGGCSTQDQITAPTNVDFTLDLTASANIALMTVGGYVYNNIGVIVAHTPSGYVAVSSACTHQGVSVQYDLGSNSFYCSAHGSRFDINGGVISGPASSSLGKYKTTLSGNSLRVYS